MPGRGCEGRTFSELGARRDLRKKKAIQFSGTKIQEPKNLSRRDSIPGVNRAGFWLGEGSAGKGALQRPLKPGAEIV